MSADSSRNSADSSYSEREDEARHSSSHKITKRLKALFCCVKRESHERVIECDPDEYDYIIEKLVVKRVPLALFAIRADLPNRHGSDMMAIPEQTSRSSSSIFGKGSNLVMSAATRGTISMKTMMDSGALSHRARSSAWRDQILDRFSTLHPELKESERPIKDPLNFPQSKRSFVDNTSEVASNIKTDVSFKRMSSVMVRDESVVHRNRPVSGFNNGKTEEGREASCERDRGNCFPGLNRKYIVSPFQVQRGSFDLETPKNVDEDTGRVDCRSLTYLGESVEDGTLQSAAASKERDLRNTAVKWRITIRRRRANVDSTAVASEVEFLRKGK
ncbi:PREDICTED: uncharacterized protein LOC106741580 [Dinoponera quadriceps]|uniref:Uncharacterized protein LOC106741580 n=1 Tax=Dinoponera quadriceps TaxID=609295 RepID=A0A6P3WT06_DINQU|nr:PREDICTED: uncharacterized protein LOC106741580 [Dinoponera quadriceps]